MRTKVSIIRRSLVVLVALAAAAGAAEAQQGPKRIYIAPDDHTDYMWAADEEAYRQAFLRMTDFYLDLADATAGNPAPFQSRWNCDGSYWMWTYERNRSPAEFARFINRVRSGHFSVPLNTLVSTYGGQPAEAVLRGMYYAGSIERRYNLRFPLAVAMENQTLPYGLGSLWAGAGARWSWRGVCDCATQVPNSGDREHDIYWWTGPDGSRLLMKWNTLFANDSIGGYAEARRPAEAINLADTNAGFQSRYPYRVIGLFGKGWDDLTTFSDEFVTVAQQQTNAQRQIIVSNEQDFFADFEATHGAALPSLSCSYGNEWDVYCASMAETSAGVKRSVERLRAAEALAALVSLRRPDFMSGREAARDLAFTNLGLYWEHAWTADGPVSRSARAAWQRRIAGELASYVETLQDDAAAALGALIRRSSAATRFYAFNPLGWPRTDYADFPLADAGAVHVVDLTTNQETPSQIVFLDGARFLRVLARDVPAVGYKVFEVRAGAGASFTNAAAVAGNVIENDFYRLTIADRGAVTSLVDKTRGGREFARSVGGRFINDLGPGSGSLAVENAGPVTVTLRATSPSPLAHTTRVTLLRDSRRIALSNEITQNFGDVRTWGFSFNLDSPDVWHEEVGAVTRAKKVSQGGHYSDRAQNSRYDWLTLNHFADMTGTGSVGVTLSNADTYFMRLGNSTASALDTATPQLSPLAGGQVDGPHLGIPNQGGDTRFLQRFALQTHGAYDAASAMRFSLEHQNPLVVGAVAGGTDYPETSYSLVQISDPNVLLWSLKPAEEGVAAGLVARVWNVADASSNFTLASPNPLLGAKRTTHIETDLADAPVAGGALTTTAAARQLQTYRLFMGAPTPTPTTTPVPTPTPSPGPVDEIPPGEPPPVFTVERADAPTPETQPSIVLTIKREGWTGAATVEYATADGTAREGQDYIMARGRLDFAAGETERHVTVLLIRDAYAEPDESFSLTLSNPSRGSQLGTPHAASLVIAASAAAAGNPADDTPFFVRQHYLDFLSREPDAGGLAFWSNGIETCGANQQCREVKRIDTSAAFFLSIEFQETGFLAYRMYKAAYGDMTGAPVPVRREEFVPDTQALGRGVEVGVGDWQRRLEQNKRAYADEFVARARFASLYPPTMSAAEFVDALNTNAGGALSAEERNALVNELGNNRMTRAAVLRRVAEDATLARAETNKAFVLMQYFGYLRRNPNEGQDTNFDGFFFWLTKLEQFGGNYVEAEMVKAFISSIEYRRRFAP